MQKAPSAFYLIWALCNLSGWAAPTKQTVCKGIVAKAMARWQLTTGETGSGWQQSKQNSALSAVVGQQA